MGGFEPHNINATACVASELSSIARAHPLPPEKRVIVLITLFFIIKNIFIAIFNDILLPFDIEIIREIFYNLSRNKFESDDKNADIHLCFTRKI